MRREWIVLLIGAFVVVGLLVMYSPEPDLTPARTGEVFSNPVGIAGCRTLPSSITR